MTPTDPIEDGRRRWLKQGWDKSDVDAMVAAVSIRRAQQLILASLDEALKPLELTFSRYEALSALDLAPDGTLPLRKMGEALMIHPATVTNAVDRLESAGLVRRKRSSTDRRSVSAEITPAGREVVKAASKAVTSVKFGLSDLRSDEVAELTKIFGRMRTNAGGQS